MTFLARQPFLPLAALLALGFFLVPSLAADVAIVTSESTAVETLDEAQVRALWLGTIERVAGTKLTVADRSASELRDEFYRHVLRKTRGQIKAIRSKRAFQHGIAPPPELLSDGSVLDWVRARENRLGYVEAASVGDPDDSQQPVRVLLIIKLPTGREQP